MKILIVVVIVQTGLLLLLFGKVADIDERLLAADDLARATPTQEFFETRPKADVLSGRQSVSDASFPNEQQLRQIIREELIAHGEAPGIRDDRAEPVIVRSESAEAEYQIRRDQVVEQIDYFSSVGRISEVEMQRLQTEIATLDKAGRREMLGRLTRALNSGELAGNL